VRHDLRLDGLAFRLRPAEAFDADFILSLRTSDRALGTLHPVSGRLADQLAWQRAYEARPDDWYWIVERRTGAPEGTIGIYDVDRVRGTGEWGRWILRPGSLAAPESCLLVYRAAFDALGLASVTALTVATNAPVLSFHDRAGLERIGVVPDAFDLGGTRVAAIRHLLTRERWPQTRGLLEGRAAQAAEMLSRI
jgi:RimJ/RimL family protein N-acetyltransferase